MRSNLKQRTPKKKLDEATAIQIAEEEINKLAKETDFSFLTDGLSEQQRLVLRMRIRGLNIPQIAKVLNVSKQAIHQMLDRIKEYHAKRGTKLAEATVIGETQSFFDLIEEEAWTGFMGSKTGGDEESKLKYIRLLVDTRKTYIELLQKLGMLKNTGNPTHTTNIQINNGPTTQLLEKIKEKGGATQIATQIIEMTQDSLEAPEPPEQEEAYVEVKEEK